jgi:hypothetical protein
MSNHPAAATLAAYVLGHHDEIDRAAIESHVQGCDECLSEVGREARLELLLGAAGREDAFAGAPAPAVRRRFWSAYSAAAAVLAAGAVATVGYALRRSDTTTVDVAASPARVSKGLLRLDAPSWATGARRAGGWSCWESQDRLQHCTVMSTGRGTLEDARQEADDAAIELLIDVALERGGAAIRAQRALYLQSRWEAIRTRDPEPDRRVRRAIASSASFGVRENWYWEQHDLPDGTGTEFVAYSRFSATADQVQELRARYEPVTVDGAELVPTVPGIRWLLDPGEQLTWFVWRPGKLAALGIRTGDVLLMNPRRNANGMLTLVERDEVMVWRNGLQQPVAPSTLPKEVDLEQK